jgi:hypothetical protein
MGIIHYKYFNYGQGLILTKDLNEAVGGALTMRMGHVRQGQRK